MKTACYRIAIDPAQLASDQLRQLAKSYNELAKLLDTLTSDPKRQCEILANLLEQARQRHAA